MPTAVPSSPTRPPWTRTAASTPATSSTSATSATSASSGVAPLTTTRRCMPASGPSSATPAGRGEVRLKSHHADGQSGPASSTATGTEQAAPLPAPGLPQGPPTAQVAERRAEARPVQERQLRQALPDAQHAAASYTLADGRGALRVCRVPRDIFQQQLLHSVQAAPRCG